MQQSLPRRLHASLDGRRGGDLVLGVRPEHVYLQGSRWAQGDPPVEPMTATVDIVEMAGDQIFLEFDVGGSLLVTRVEPDAVVRRGDRVNFWFDTGSLHLFDPRSEMALPAGDAAA